MGLNIRGIIVRRVEVNTPVTESYARLEPFDRGLECEHTDNPNPPTGDLEPCHLEAEFTISTPMWSDETRTRYCSIHVWDALERQVEKLQND